MASCLWSVGFVLELFVWLLCHLGVLTCRISSFKIGSTISLSIQRPRESISQQIVWSCCWVVPQNDQNSLLNPSKPHILYFGQARLYYLDIYSKRFSAIIPIVGCRMNSQTLWVVVLIVDSSRLLILIALWVFGLLHSQFELLVLEEVVAAQF